MCIPVRLALTLHTALILGTKQSPSSICTKSTIDGSIETARGFRDGSVVDKRKVDQVLSELDICMEWW